MTFCITTLLNGLPLHIYHRPSSVLHDDPNRYSIGTPLKENVVAQLDNTSRLEFNTRCGITIFHLYKTFLIKVWPLDSVRNK